MHETTAIETNNKLFRVKIMLDVRWRISMAHVFLLAKFIKSTERQVAPFNERKKRNERKPSAKKIA